MDSIDKILDTIEQEVNDGVEVGKRIQQKTFGLFTNPVFLLTFFTFMFVTIGYKIYHYYKREDDTRCATYDSDEKCPGYCVWDNEECSPKLKAGNACPDFWDTSVKVTPGTGKGSKKITTITCTNKNTNIKVDEKCYNDSKKKTLTIKDGAITDWSSKCEWMKKCGPWEGQGMSRFGCQVDSKTPAEEATYMKEWGSNWN